MLARHKADPLRLRIVAWSVVVEVAEQLVEACVNVEKTHTRGLGSAPSPLPNGEIGE